MPLKGLFVAPNTVTEDVAMPKYVEFHVLFLICDWENGALMPCLDGGTRTTFKWLDGKVGGARRSDKMQHSAAQHKLEQHRAAPRPRTQS